MITNFNEQYLTFDDLCIRPAINEGTPEQVSLRSSVTRHYTIHFPVLSAAMPHITGPNMAIAMGEFGGLGVVHRYMPVHEQCLAIESILAAEIDQTEFPLASLHPATKQLITAASVDPLDRDRAIALCQSGVHILFLDTSNPGNRAIIEGVKRLRDEVDVDLVIGSVVTEEIAQIYIDLGIDALKVGLGSGALCSMRLASGVGVPQATAVEKCFSVTKDKGIPLISDGGTKNSGDIVKAIAVGASAVMIGSLLGGTDEAPGERVVQGETTYQIVSGLRLSLLEIDAPTGIRKVDQYLQHHDIPRVEGGSAKIKAKGPCQLTLLQLLRGIRCGFHLGGAKSIAELRANASLVRASFAGIAEASIQRLS